MERLSETIYSAPLEIIAPGINDVIDSQQQMGDAWPATLKRVLPELNATNEQQAILNEQAVRAAQGYAIRQRNH